MRAGSNWAGDAALFSLLHAGVVRVDEDGKLRRGSKPLPDDAPKIERCVLERAAGLDAKSTREVVVARVDRLAQGSVILSAVVTAVALEWMVSTAGATGQGLRETPSFLVDAPIIVGGPYGRRGPPKPMPPVVWRHRSAACDPEAAAQAEKGPFAKLAEIERREREAEGPKPLTAEERAHLGVAGSLYGVTSDRLFEITLGERRVTTREVAPLLVVVPVLGPERALQEDEYFSVSVDALGFDRNGLLWATGDER